MTNNKAVVRHSEQMSEMELSSTDIQMPSATDCKIFEEISPWSLDRFITVYEKENEFRHKFYYEMMQHEVKMWNKWMNYALGFWLWCMLLSAYMVYMGQTVAWVAVIITEMIAWIALFLRTWYKKEELTEQKEETKKLKK